MACVQVQFYYLDKMSSYNSSKYYGHPFSVILLRGEMMEDLRPRLLERSGLSREVSENCIISEIGPATHRRIDELSPNSVPFELDFGLERSQSILGICNPKYRNRKNSRSNFRGNYNTNGYSYKPYRPAELKIQ